jgi:hypothetical protein
LRPEKVRDKIKKEKERERKKAALFITIFFKFFFTSRKKISANYSLRSERMFMTHFCLSQSFNFYIDIGTNIGTEIGMCMKKRKKATKSATE